MLTPEKINEMAIDSYLTDPLKPVVCMTDDALHHFAGAIESLANQEKDADIERLKCAHSDMAEMYRKSQEHVTELSAMTEGQREVLTDLDDRLEKAQSEFKNFHRALCERFNYCHDQADWKRDQVSLIEHIANSWQSSQSQATGKVQVSGRNKEIIVSVDGEIQFIKQIDETPLAFSHVVRSSQSQVSDALPITRDDIREMIGIAQVLRDQPHWELQAGSRILAEITERLNDALQSQSTPVGKEAGK